jgi:hypothetical protein
MMPSGHPYTGQDHGRMPGHRRSLNARAELFGAMGTIDLGKHGGSQ